MIDTAETTTPTTQLTRTQYPAYKDSGVEWLGKVPAHWEIVRIKNACAINKFSLPENTNKSFHFQYVDIGSVTLEDGILQTEEFDFKNAPSRARRIAKKDDTIISTVRTYLKAIDFIDEQKSEYIYSTGFAILTPAKRIAPKFLAMAVRSNSFTDQVAAYSKGMSYPAINSTELSRLEIPLPPLAEQTRIAEFLDRKTAQIDQAIAQKERLIELLNERRQVMIHQAVTRGLDPNVPMKDSGIEWLGEIPSHWQMKKLKYLSCKISKGTTPSTIGKEMVTEGVRFLKAENITENSISVEPAFFIDELTNRALSRSILQGDDILFVIAGATIGKTAVLPQKLAPSNTNQAVCFIRPNGIVHPYVISELLQTSYIKQVIQYQSVVSAQPNISMEDVGNFMLPVTLNKDEQIDIFNCIFQIRETYSYSIIKLKNQIQKLQELKSTLINSAVTGKIKV